MLHKILVLSCEENYDFSLPYTEVLGAVTSNPSLLISFSVKPISNKSWELNMIFPITVPL